MAIKEQDKVFYEELANGDKVINLPITRANNVEGLGRSANTAYAVGDVVYTDNNNKVALKCVTAGTTSADELDISAKNIGDTVTDGSVVWQVCNRTSDVTSVNGKTGNVVVDLPVGHMYWSVEPNVPAGRLPAFGATYNRALYADLWNWANSVGLVKTESEWQAIASANDGNCAYYSDGDGSTTFRVPKLPNTLTTDIADELAVKGNGMAIGITGANGYTGGLIHNYSNFYGLTGASTSYGQAANTIITSAGSYPPSVSTIGLTTDASKSGIVAQTSSTKITGQWLIVAFGVAHNVGNADVENVMQAVEQVQTGLGTLEQGVGTAIDYIIESYRNNTQWYEVYKSGKLRQGGTFDGTANGFNTVTFPKAFSNVDYSVLANYGADSTNMYSQYIANSKTTTSVQIKTYNNVETSWYVEGQGA